MRKLKLPGRDESRPRLNEHDVALINELGVNELKEQARNIVEAKLKEQPENDGKQTPTAGNPIYKAMHACNCASREELSRAHRIPAGRTLSERNIDSIVNLLVRWMVREYNFYKEENSRQKNLGEFA
ncbi:MAG: DUF4186 family protein [Candidatus Nanohalobium sp.]